jgi:hypothetical protein
MEILSKNDFSDVGTGFAAFQTYTATSSDSSTPVCAHTSDVQA